MLVLLLILVLIRAFPLSPPPPPIADGGGVGGRQLRGEGGVQAARVGGHRRRPPRGGRAVPTAAIGDVRDRLAMVGSGMYKCVGVGLFRVPKLRTGSGQSRPMKRTMMMTPGSLIAGGVTFAMRLDRILAHSLPPALPHLAPCPARYTSSGTTTTRSSRTHGRARASPGNSTAEVRQRPSVLAMCPVPIRTSALRFPCVAVLGMLPPGWVCGRKQTPRCDFHKIHWRPKSSFSKSTMFLELPSRIRPTGTPSPMDISHRHPAVGALHPPFPQAGR